MADHKAQSDPAFVPLLGGFPASALEASASTVFGLWPNLELAYLNPAWFRFAAANEGEPMISRDWGLGRNVLDSASPVIRPFFEENYARCLRTARPWVHIYDCSSIAVHRLLHLTAYPLANRSGLLVVNSTRIEAPRTRPDGRPVLKHYVDSYGFITQCSHCRRFRRTDVESRWEWIADWITQMPPNTCHGLCDVCFPYYFGEQAPWDVPPEPFSS
jgi:hypothetical protein